MRINFLAIVIASSLLCGVALPLKAKELAAGKRRNIEALAKAYNISIEQAGALKADIKDGFCCEKAHESVPGVFAIPEHKCKGTRWSMAIAGACYEYKKDAVCFPDFGKTVVTIHEYALTWNEGACNVAQTGKTQNVEVTESSGLECP
jgi:hypothetical protein